MTKAGLRVRSDWRRGISTARIPESTLEKEPLPEVAVKASAKRATSKPRKPSTGVPAGNYARNSRRRTKMA